jgi:hypothetical protein
VEAVYAEVMIAVPLLRTDEAEAMTEEAEEMTELALALALLYPGLLMPNWFEYWKVPSASVMIRMP